MENPNEQRGAPSMDDALNQKESRSNPISDSPAGKLLHNFIATMNRYGEDAQDAYEEALTAMQNDAEEVMIEIAQAYGHCHQNDYPFRWALVHAAAELRHPAALSFLANLVKTPIPPERSKNPHSFSTVAEETILRTTAVEGVENLYKEENNDKIVELLFEFLKKPSLSIRRASVQALLSINNDKKQQKRISELLPDDQRFLLEIQRKKVEEVPQIKDPQRHLTEVARQKVEKESPPRVPGEPEDDAPQVH